MAVDRVRGLLFKAGFEVVVENLIGDAVFEGTFGVDGVVEETLNVVVVGCLVGVSVIDD